MKLAKFNHVLGRKILFYILLCSSLLSVLATLIQLYSDYKYDVSEIGQRFYVVENSYLEPLALNLWDFQDKAVQQQLNGITNLPNVHYVELTTPQGSTYRSGNKQSGETQKRVFDVVHQQNTIGKLVVEVNYHEIYQKLINKTGVILLTQFIKTLIAAFAIMGIIYWLVTRHLYRIVDFSTGLSLTNLEERLSLSGKRENPDELDLLVSSLNKARTTLSTELSLRLQAEEELKKLNVELESLVQQRTSQLKQALDELKEAQSDLILAEKMAALGELVAGIAHEINTPLGISVTANSVISESINKAQKALEQESLSRAQLDETFSEIVETSDLLTRNLIRATELIKSFKSVAVNQTNDSLLNLNFKLLMSEILDTVQTVFRSKNYTIIVDVDENLQLLTYPGAWAQILTNLLMNSHNHGFEDNVEGTIRIAVEQQGQDYLFTYQDDGSGIPSSIMNKIFDPFVTTKRGRGGSGLGLNILFNLVYEKLKGTVKVANLERGCIFTIKAPISIEQER